jgi:SAM-dependent methyltransferase
MSPSDIYTDGSYFTKTGHTWHLEDSSFKASQILRMLDRHPEIGPESICDIGCGAGRVLSILSQKILSSTRLVGYEVSPQAHSLSQQFNSDHCSFVLGDPFADGQTFDVALVLDVVEHVEDSFGFLRSCAAKGNWKLYHIPLDMSASTILRRVNCWDSVGHLHLFTVETALRSVEHSGQRVCDWFLTPVSIERPHRRGARFVNVARRLMPSGLASRLLGGYSILVLAK